MKKSLLAVAVAAALPAVATAQVTISGLLDIAYGNSSGFQSGSTFSTRDFTSATSGIRFTATEDLGGGLRATVQYDLDPRAWMNNADPIVRNESFLGLSGSFGNLRLGSPNSIGVTTWLVAAPLGTGIGSGYGTDAAAHSFVRHNRSMRYDSPSFEGFTVSLNYAPGNDRASGEYPGFVANATRTIPEVSGAHLSPRAPEVRELGANYAAGPFNLAIAHIVLPGQNIDGIAGADATKEISHTLLSGRFTTGATQLSGGWHQGDLMQNLRTDPSADGLRAQFTGAAPRKVNTTNFKVEGFRLGIQHDIGAVSLRGKYTESSISNSDDSELKAYNTTKRSLSWTTFGFRADYNFSKRSAVYFGFEQWRLPTEISKLNTLPAGTPANENARVLTSVGMRHSF